MPIMLSSLPALQFNADLTDCILTALSDFQSLQGFISSAKFVYSVFRCRQSSILGAVAHNQFGPALPQAMCLVRCIGGTRFSGHEFPQEADFTEDFTITPVQAGLLRDHAAIVRTLEDIYSWREKDPRSRSSRLSAAESLKFQQSVYRLWLLAAAYRPGSLVDERLEYSNDNHLQLRNSIVTKQMTFLLSLGNIGLVGVDEIHRFLLDLAKWALVKRTTRPTRPRLGFGDRDDIYLVWSGPAVILDAFRRKWPSFRPIDSQWYGTWRAMTHTFFGTEIASITGGRVLGTTRQRFVLDDYYLKTIDCSQCRGLSSLSRRDSLWSFCNWEYMVLAIAPSRLGSFLSFERRRQLELLVSLTEAVESILYPQFIEEIFDVRSDRYKDWRKDDWLCTQCMTKLLSDNIQIWFNEKRAKTDTTTN